MTLTTQPVAQRRTSSETDFSTGTRHQKSLANFFQIQRPNVPSSCGFGDCRPRLRFPSTPFQLAALTSQDSNASSPRSPVVQALSSSPPNPSRTPPPNSRSTADQSTPSYPQRRQPRIQVSSLLADSQTRTYHLEVVQHPQKTAEFGIATLSRLPLTPPIIVQLTVRDPSGNSIVPEAELPFLIAHLSLYSENGSVPLDTGSSIGLGLITPILYGNLVSSIDQLEDLQGNMGLFFLFPDVSIRDRGRFQLGITLLRISSPDSSGGFSIAELGTVLAQARTEPFDVLPHSEYVAAPQTRLTQCFIRQGARMFTFLSQSSS